MYRASFAAVAIFSMLSSFIIFLFWGSKVLSYWGRGQGACIAHLHRDLGSESAQS